MTYYIQTGNIKSILYRAKFYKLEFFSPWDKVWKKSGWTLDDLNNNILFTKLTRLSKIKYKVKYDIKT